MAAYNQDIVPILVHQLRSSLATVRLAHQVLLEDENKNLTDKQRHFLHQAQLRTNRMLYLTDDLLEPSTEAPSILAIFKRPASIEELVDETLEEFNVRLTDKKLGLTRHRGEKPVSVPFDYEKLQDALRNLVDNAIKYTPENGHISITTSYSTEQVVIEISDTGIGVPKNKEPELFNKFVRMENAKFIDQTGLGLGLYIVRRVVEEHGGSLTYKANKPTGAVFTITLPMSL